MGSPKSSSVLLDILYREMMLVKRSISVLSYILTKEKGTTQKLKFVAKTAK